MITNSGVCILRNSIFIIVINATYYIPTVRSAREMNCSPKYVIRSVI
jgi:hypothetical protein